MMLFDRGHAKDMPLFSERFSASYRYRFYRAMHVVLARYCYRKSSICPSVLITLTFRGYIVEIEPMKMLLDAN